MGIPVISRALIGSCQSAPKRQPNDSKMGQITGPFLRLVVLSILKIFPNHTARAGLTLQIWALRCGDDLGLFRRLLRPMILHLRGGQDRP